MCVVMCRLRKPRVVYGVISTWRCLQMAEVIRDFKYSRTVGRGRGILGLTDLTPCRKPGSSCGAAKNESVKADECTSQEAAIKLVVAMYSYTADPKAPGGFAELSLKQGESLVLLGEHSSNEHWWEVKNEDGQTGFVPSSYLIVKDDTVLPWLSLSSLKSEEEERQLRLRRLKQEAMASQGKGLGPAPKNLPPVHKPYISSYDSNNKLKAGPSQYYCEVCDKHLNGPQPYKAHMASKAHKEELALRQ